MAPCNYNFSSFLHFYGCKLNCRAIWTMLWQWGFPRGYFAINIVTNSTFDLNFFHLSASKNCKINKVEVMGCRKERNAATECKLRRNENASISIELMPDFDGTNITMLAYTTAPIEAQWPGMDSDACKFMSCPVQKDVLTTYIYAMKLTPEYPRVSCNLCKFCWKLNEFLVFREHSQFGGWWDNTVSQNAASELA